MLVGVPKEIKLDEHRVGLTPDSARELTRRGHRVLVEAGAGCGIGAADAAYQAAGAEIVDANTVFDRSELIMKVKEPQREEWDQLREVQILFTYLHLA
jgi:alanine dehydrogenase